MFQYLIALTSLIGLWSCGNTPNQEHSMQQPYQSQTVFHHDQLFSEHADPWSSVSSDQLKSTESQIQTSSQLIRELKKQGYVIGETNTDPIDFNFFSKWSPENQVPDDDDQNKQYEYERQFWEAVHDDNISIMGRWLRNMTFFLTFERSSYDRFPRLNVIQPFGCLRSFAYGNFHEVINCVWFDGEQSWVDGKTGREYDLPLPFTDGDPIHKYSTNINAWVMRYSMVSFRNILLNRAEKAVKSLEFQARLGVEGRASAAFTYGIIRHDAKIRIRMPDGRLLTPLERALDLLQNCEDSAPEYHDKVCRHASPLAPHKFSGMLLALAELQGRAAGVLSKPELMDQKIVEAERIRHKESMGKTLALLQTTETAEGYFHNLDPSIKEFADKNDVTLKPWPFASRREQMVKSLPDKIDRWSGKKGILPNHFGLAIFPLPEYAKGEACMNCHYQANEMFHAGYKPQW